jgi:PKD repeat protein
MKLKGRNAKAVESVDRNHLSPIARIARTLKTPRGGISILLAAVLCLGAVHLASADPLDPTKPVPSFTISPDSPLTGETVIFTSTSEPGLLGGPIATEEWDLDNDGNFDNGTGSEVDRLFATAGTYTVGLKVTDTNGSSDVATGTVTVQNRPPAAGISISPSSPSTFETITFTSSSTDDDGTIASYAWDLDNDGNFDNGFVSEVHGSFPIAGSYTVRLLVTDNDGGTDIATLVVDVGNQLPLASFDYSPTNPSTGDEITLTSTSSDPEGPLASYSWDLDGDNTFGDATGPQEKITFASAGSHTVRLRVTDGNGASATATDSITVANRGPVGSFDSSPSNPKTGDPVTFTSTATDPDGSIASHAWDLDNDGNFDDGSGPSAQKSFATSGTHTVRLRVTDNNDDFDIATGTVQVENRGPSASFDVSSSSPQTGEEVTLTSTSSDPDGSIASYSWDLNGDGTYGDATIAQATVTFGSAGNHTVRLHVTDDSGATDVAELTIAVANRAPTAAFEYSPASPTSSELITFTSTSSDPDGSIASIAWDLDNDGAFDDGDVGTVHGSFDTPGPHTVKLNVTDNDGASDSTTLTIQVANRAPVASFTSAPDTPAPLTGQQVTFTSTSTDPDGSIASVAWDLDNDGNFDDGNGSSAQRTFATAGTYTVRMRATDNNDATDVATGSVTIANRAPAASFGSSPAAPKTGEEVTFNSTSTDPDGSIASYSWDLNGDGTYGDSTAASPKHIFLTPGLHTVSLQVTDNDSATDVATETIAIANRPPVASFDNPATNPQTLEDATFTSTATDPDGTIAAYAWDLDNDGQYDDAAAQTATRQFPVAGSYTIRLMVTDSHGATATATRSVTILNRPPVASFTTAPETATTDGPVTFTSTSTDPENLPLTTTWDLDNNGSFETTGATAQKTFTAPGTYTVRISVSDASSASNVATGTVVVPNRPPTATVDHAPLNPQTGAAITFTATSNDPENRVKSIAWDDEDADELFNNGTGQTLVKTYRRPGGYTVRFRIEDQDGEVKIAEDAVAVGNRAPVADFVVLPQPAYVNTPFTLISTSLDPDTALDKWLWDLDGDGQYDDAEGASVQHGFGAAGSYEVGLQVIDSENVTNAARKSVVVQVPPAPAAPQTTQSGPTLRLLSPFPVVRLAGRISRAGTRLRLFSIEAPPGARVVVRCNGRSCPFRLSARSAGADGGKGKVRSSATLRIRQLEKRVLKKGVKITIFVTKPGVIGKYVQFKFRKRRPPARVDRCLMPSAPKKPVECPS